MKKIFLKKVIFLAGITGAVYFTSHKEKSQVNDLLLSNIEALADGESGSALRCFGYGSVDCQGYKVKWKMSRSFFK